MSSTFGRLFRVHSFGESHGPALGCVVDGCPPGIPIDTADIQNELARRRPGQSALVSQRKEQDVVEILSGVHDGRSLGTPIALLVRNEDARPSAYQDLADLYRPSHADFTTEAKYGLRSPSGGGRASARETVARVAAGAIAQRLLRERYGVEIVAWVERVGEVEIPSGSVDESQVSKVDVDVHPTRCPHLPSADSMAAAIEGVRAAGDTLGGTIRCIARGLPPGWGEPVFGKLDAELGRAIISLPACKGMDIGAGFAATRMKGSEHNDPFVPSSGEWPVTSSNNSGGIQAGISNGAPLRLSAAFKPVSTIFLEQDTVNRDGKAVRFRPKGRHDPCVLPRAVPMVEAMVALVLADLSLLQRALGQTKG